MARALALMLCSLVVAVVTVACMGNGDGDATAADQTTRRVTEETARIPQMSPAELEAAGLADLPLAPDTQRVDLAIPTFSSPTKVTNPLFPIGDLHSAILNGTVDDKRFRVETTLLPETRIIEWPKGRPVRTLVSQYVAYLDGRIEEVALDFYAQADDGSVWYFGEDVFNYKDGFIADTEGTWIAGKDGPAAMIMPADPQVGDVYRPENVPGLVFEEVTVKSVDETASGPRGPVEGAMIAEELHQDGAREDKTFAPAYGEFFTGSGGDVEALALAVPTDAPAGQVPAELDTMLADASRVYTLAGAETWEDAARAARRVDRAWQAFQEDGVPPRLEPVTTRAVKDLVDAVDARDGRRAQETALEVIGTTLDLALRHRPPSEIDRGRFVLWTQRFVMDASAEEAQATRGDLATLEWIADRFIHTLPDVEAIQVHAELLEMRTNVTDGNLQAAARESERLRTLLAGP
jgi:hypothetical protein